MAGVPRDSYYIASKVGRYELDIDKMFDFSAEKTEAAVDNTLALLGLDYVDIIQVSKIITLIALLRNIGHYCTVNRL